MFTKILLPTDGSPLASLALNKGLTLAAEQEAKVHALMVIEPFHTLSMEAGQLSSTRASYELHMKEAAEEHLLAVADKARKMGLVCETTMVIDGSPYQVIIDTARARGCDLVVMGSHGRGGLGAMVLGSQTLKVLTHSTLPVLVYRQEKAG
ncbi:universal stress protein [Radicibacter daui]|uniref:universal stress protein n=1 Tax=Radicibacter daui TaxID=3064829 RepID=UPI004046EA37